MGIIKKIFHRDMTPEELEEKSRKEQEIAEKCYNAGLEVREKLGLERRINSVNKFANKYPITFFAILFGIVIGSCVINFLFSSSSGFFEKTSEDINSIPTIEQTFDQATIDLKRDIAAKYEEMETIGHEIEAYLKKDSLSHEDSLVIRDKLIRFQTLSEILEKEKK